MNKNYNVKIFSPKIYRNLDFVCNKIKFLKDLICESDVILINLSPRFWPPILKAINYCKEFNKYYYIWFHNVLDEKFYTKLYKKRKLDYKKRLIKLKEIFNDPLCSKIFCISFAVKNSIKNLVEDKNKIKVIYPGIKIPSFQIKQIKKDFITDFIFIGRLREEKNLERLIKVFRYLKDDANLIIVGANHTEVKKDLENRIEVKKDLENLVKKLNLSKSIKILPYQKREKVFELISKSKFLINPSLVESLSLITVESILIGTPVILSKTPGHLEVTQSKYGLFFDPYDIKDMIKKMKYALKHYDEMLKKTKIAQKILIKKFDHEKQWFEYEKELVFNHYYNFSRI